MENKELLFNLIKKLESGEIQFCSDSKGDSFWLDFGDNNNFSFRVYLDRDSWDGNKEFKENFYKEKGLDNCWVKDCPNKIYQKEGDYKKVRVECKDKHTRMVCWECYNQNTEW